MLLARRKVIRINDFPVKLYVFDSYIRNCGNMRDAERRIRNVFEFYEGMAPQPIYSFSLTFCYSDECGEKEESADIFSCRLGKAWNDDPLYEHWKLRNIIFAPAGKGIARGSILQIVGREERLRASSLGIEHYLSQWPPLDGINHNME